VAAVVAMIVTAVRRRWYAQYLLVLESLMTVVLDKASTAREAGVTLPRGAAEGPGVPEKEKGGPDAAPEKEVE
jgi:hypothetical protein